jgi:hypothetical protein
MDRDPIHLGNDAKTFLQDEIFRLIVSNLAKYYERELMVCDKSDLNALQVIAIKKQVLNDLESEIHRLIDDGELAREEVEGEEKLALFRR